MKLILGILLTAIFLILASLHLYWLFGGKWGMEKALPTNLKGEFVLNPGKIDTSVVSIGLLGFAAFYFVKSGLSSWGLPSWLMQYGAWIIPMIFILRAIGDFKYIGIFKKIETTEFAKLDSAFYMPLCLIIGILGLIIVNIK